MNAIILSAGLGTRLRPITQNIPKPLLPIVHRPIIEVNIERLINCGIENIGVNLFHKADLIKKFLKESSSHLRIVVEKKLRGTGGALLNFRDLIKDDVIIHNVDVLSNIDIGAAIEFHKFRKPLATLILTDRCGTNVLKIDETFRIIDFAKTDTKNYYTYTGVAILSEKISSYLPEKYVFSIIDVYKRLIDEKLPIIGFLTKKAWCDIGTHEAYWNVHYEILRKKVRFDGLDIDSPIYIHPSSKAETRNLGGFISIGPNCSISEKVGLKNTIVFENSNIEEGYFENSLLSDKFCIKIR